MLKSISTSAEYNSIEFKQGASERDWTDYTLSVVNKPPAVSFASDNTNTNLSVKGYAIATGNEVIIGNGSQVVKTTLGTVSPVSVAGGLSGDSYSSSGSLSIGTQDTYAMGMTFSSDGTKFYIVGLNTKSIYQYNLSTAFNLSTATYSGLSFNVSSQDATPYDILFNPTGTIMLISGAGNNTVYQYNLSTPWVINTASYSGFSLGNQVTLSPCGIQYNSTGSRLYAVGANGDSIITWSINSYSLSSAAWVSGKNISGQTSRATYFKFNQDGTEFFVLDGASFVIYKFTMSTPYDVQNSTYVGAVRTMANTGGESCFCFGGTNYYERGAVDTVYQYALGTPFTFSSPSYDNVSFSVAGQGTLPRGVAFSSDGTKMYFNDYTQQRVYQYNLSTAWSVNTAVYSGSSFSLSGQMTSGTAPFFSADGTKMYVGLDGVGQMFQYNLSTPWAINTASYTSGQFLNTQTAGNRNGAFNPTGTRLFILDATNDAVYQYNLSTPWMLNTAVYSGFMFTISGQETQPTGLAFNNDGTRMYVVGYNGNIVYQYTVNSPWEMGSLNYYGSSFNVISQSSNTSGLAFSSDGTKLFIMADSADSVFQYSIPNGNNSYTKYTSNISSLGFSAAPNLLVKTSDALQTYVSFSSENNTLTSNYDISKKVTSATATQLVYNDTVGAYEPAVGSKVGLHKLVSGVATPVEATLSEVGKVVVGDAYDLSGASYSGLSFSVAAQDVNPAGIAFNSDGTRMYITGAAATDSVYQYSLSTAWNINTAVYSNITFYVGSQTTGPAGIAFNPAGTKMYIVGNSTNAVYEYNLSTPWTVNTASLNATATNITSAPWSIAFSSDGTKMYLTKSDSSKTIIQYSLPTAWSVVGAIDTGTTFSFAAQTTTGTLYGLAFNSTGTRLFMNNYEGKIYQYNLSTPWAITTAAYSNKSTNTYTTNIGIALSSSGSDIYITTYPSGGTSVYQYSLQQNQFTLTYPDIGDVPLLSYTPDLVGDKYTSKFFSVATQDGSSPVGTYFGNNGTKLYMLGSTSNTLYQYTLSTAWDVSTATYDNVSVTVNADTIYGITFSADGTKFYFIDYIGKTVYQWGMTTAWNISTATYSSIFVNLGSNGTTPIGLSLSSDGTRMFIADNGTDSITQWNLSTAWNISTAVYSSVLSVATQTTGPYGVTFNANGQTMFVTSAGGDNSVYEYSLSTAWTINTATYTQRRFNFSAQGTTGICSQFSIDGKSMYVFCLSTARVFQYALASAFTFTGTAYSGLSFSVAGQDTAPRKVAFSTDGMIMFILGGTNDTVYRYNLTSPFTINTATYSGQFIGVGSQDTDPQGIAFNSDGTRMFILGGTNDTVYQYNIPSSWAVNQASNSGLSFYVGSQAVVPGGIAFNSDGTRMFIADTQADTIYQYNLSTAWTVNTASYSGLSFSVASQSSNPWDVKFSADGTKMFVPSTGTGTIYQYNLSTAWTVNTASYSGLSFSATGQETDIYGITFNSDGTRLFTVGVTNDTVYQYQVAQPLTGGTIHAKPNATQPTLSSVTYSSTNLKLDYQKVQKQARALRYKHVSPLKDDLVVSTTFQLNKLQ